MTRIPPAAMAVLLFALPLAARAATTPAVPQDGRPQTTEMTVSGGAHMYVVSAGVVLPQLTLTWVGDQAYVFELAGGGLPPAAGTATPVLMASVMGGWNRRAVGAQVPRSGLVLDLRAVGGLSLVAPGGAFQAFGPTIAGQVVTTAWLGHGLGLSVGVSAGVHVLGFFFIYVPMVRGTVGLTF